MEVEEGSLALGGSSGGASIEGFVERDAVHGRWRARIRLVAASGETLGVREVDSLGPDCASLTPALLIVLAWLVDSRPEPVSPPLERAIEPAERRASSRSGQAPNQLPATSAPAWAGEFGIGLAAAIGVNPAPTFGPRLEVHLRTPWRLGLELGVNYWSADRVALEDPSVPGAAVTFRALQTNLALSVGLLRRGAWGLSGSWGGVLGLRLTRGSGLRESGNPARVYGGPSSGLRLAYDLSARWSVTLQCAGVAFGRDDRFTYVARDSQPRVLFRPPPFGGWSSLGLLARL